MARGDAPYWRVSPRFWADTAAWSDDARYLAIYLLTCEHRTTEGLFVLRLPYIHADLGWPAERLVEPLAELIAERFIEHDAPRSVFLIVNALKYQAPANPNSRIAALRKLSLVPSDSPLTSTFKRLCQQFCQPLHDELPKGFGEPPAPAPSSISSATWLSSAVTRDSEADLSTARAALKRGRTA